MFKYNYVMLMLLLGCTLMSCSQGEKATYKVSKVQTLSQERAIPVCEGSENDITCRPQLIIAIGHGDLATVRSIIESGVDPNTHYDVYFGVTPLMEAVMTGQVEIAQYLLEQGADPNVRIPVDPIKRAEADGYFDLVEKMKIQ